MEILPLYKRIGELHKNVFAKLTHTIVAHLDLRIENSQAILLLSKEDLSHSRKWISLALDG